MIHYWCFLSSNIGFFCRNFSRDKFPGSQHRGWLTTLNGAAVFTELLKITLKTPWGRKTLWQWPPSGYFGSIFPYCSPVSGGGGDGLNYSNIEDVLNNEANKPFKHVSSLTVLDLCLLFRFCISSASFLFECEPVGSVRPNTYILLIFIFALIRSKCSVLTLCCNTLK